MNTMDAAYHVAHDYPGGADVLGLRLGKRPGVLGNEVKAGRSPAPGCTAKLGLADAEKITMLSGDLRILQAFAANCGQMLLPLPQHIGEQEDAALGHLAAMAKEFADACKAIADVLNDNQVSDNELAIFDKEAGELIASLHAARASLARINLAGKPAHLRAPE